MDAEGFEPAIGGMKRDPITLFQVNFQAFAVRSFEQAVAGAGIGTATAWSVDEYR